jgi:putative glutamine amidotransferase
MPPTEEVPDDVALTTGIDPYDSSGLDGADALLLPGGAEALRRDMPVLAICHGMQLLNVHTGGTLDQHLADRGNRLEHDRDRPRAEAAHGAQLDESSPLAQMIGSGAAPVNSHHHQGLDRVGEGLEEIAWAEDGVLEGVYAPEMSWVVGVQWHPEAMAPVDPRQLAIFENFVAAAGANTQQTSAATELSA